MVSLHRLITSTAPLRSLYRIKPGVLYLQGKEGRTKVNCYHHTSTCCSLTSYDHPLRTLLNPMALWVELVNLFLHCLHLLVFNKLELGVSFVDTIGSNCPVKERNEAKCYHRHLICCSLTSWNWALSIFHRVWWLQLPCQQEKEMRWTVITTTSICYIRSNWD